MPTKSAPQTESSRAGIIRGEAGLGGGFFLPCPFWSFIKSLFWFCGCHDTGTLGGCFWEARGWLFVSVPPRTVARTQRGGWALVLGQGGLQEGVGWPWRPATVAARTWPRDIAWKKSIHLNMLYELQKVSLPLWATVSLPVLEDNSCPNNLTRVRKRMWDKKKKKNAPCWVFTKWRPSTPVPFAMSHFTDEEGETQKIAVTCPKS